MCPEKSLSVIVPTVRGDAPKRGRIIDLIRPLLPVLPIREVIVAGRWNQDFLVGGCGVPLLKLRRTRLERSYLRNTAARHARGSHLLFLDDDTIPLVSRSLARQFAALPELALLTMARRRYWAMGKPIDVLLRRLRAGRHRPQCVSRLPSTREDDDQYAAQMAFASNFGIIARRTFWRVGGYNEDLRGWGFEDVDLMNRVLRGGAIVSCWRTACAVHLDHLVVPEKMTHARRNYALAIKAYRGDASIPYLSSHFYGVASGIVRRIDPTPRLTTVELRETLARTPHFVRCPEDVRPTVACLLRATRHCEILAIAAYGSSASKALYRDVDLCVVCASGEDHFRVFAGPSGKTIEIHLVPLATIGRQLASLQYQPETAFLNWTKWRSLTFLSDRFDVVERYIEGCLDGCDWAAFLTSFSVGEAWTLVHKHAEIDRLSATRHFKIIAGLANLAVPPVATMQDCSKASSWLRSACRRLRADYRKQRRRAKPRKILLYPANHVGDSLLRSVQ
jgi:hypothetical protein